MHPEWKSLLSKEFESNYFLELRRFVKEEYAKARVYPPAGKIFRALDTTPPSSIKVLILGQDPYHGPGQANGLCFSVNDGIPHPPSLLNIFKELKRDLDIDQPVSGDLGPWAESGVLLLNATLTVRERQAGSHQNRGWEQFTDAIISVVSEQCNSVVFMLWGAYARKKAALIDSEKHLVLQAPHPSPLSAHRGFIGCAHFSSANAYLQNSGRSPVEWDVLS